MSESYSSVASFLDAHPDIEIIEALLPDLAGGLRGKWVTRDKAGGLSEGALKMPVSALAFDSWGRDVEAWVFEAGDGDGIAVPSLPTLGRVSYAERPTGQIMVSLTEADGSPCELDARYLLQRVLQRFSERGLTPVVATELEFYLLGEESDALGRPSHTQTDRVGGALETGQTYSMDAMAEQAAFMHDVRDACLAMGLPIDTLIKEGAPSQYEVNLHHTADALAAADQGVLLQRAIRGVARRHGMRATFMAKPFGDLCGNGLHVHCSLLDPTGKNVLAGAAPGEVSPLLPQAVAGVLDTLPECMLLYAPHLNSYRRFRPGMHAPLAPTWGFENRTTAVRIPAGAPEATRLEFRVPGADAQPHLVITALLASMLYGIENALQPPEPMAGSGYDQPEVVLPRYLPDALARFQGSEFIASAFGKTFQKVYGLMKEQELAEYDRHVTPLEYDAGL